MPPTRLVLASQSPRRRLLLALLPYPLTTIVPDVDEDLHLDADPATYVLRTAQQKAEAASVRLPEINGSTRTIVIAADTTVALEDQVMGKPGNAAEARDMLIALRGRTHQVHTGLCLVDRTAHREELSVHSAEVTMRAYSDDELEAYIATGDPFDKAGAYAIQDPVFRPVEHLAGCYLGVMGLSICDLVRLLARLELRDSLDMAVLAELHRGFDCPLFKAIQPARNPGTEQ